VAVGLAETSIGIGLFSTIVAAGLIEQVNTAAYTQGTILYVNALGLLTSTEPTNGFSQPIAFVLRSHSNNGALQVLAAYPKQSADDVRYSNTVSGLDSTNVQDAIDEITALALGVDLSGKVDKIGTDDIRITDATKGLILTDSNNVSWRITMETDGAIRTTVV